MLLALSVDKSSTTDERGCCVIPLLAKTVGDTEILVVLNRRDLPPLESRLTISVFEPLKVELGRFMAPKFDLPSFFILRW